MGYDNWLGQPYEDEAAREAAVEAFSETRAYCDALKEWAVDDATTRERFEQSGAFADAFEAWTGGGDE